MRQNLGPKRGFALWDQPVVPLLDERIVLCGKSGPLFANADLRFSTMREPTGLDDPGFRCRSAYGTFRTWANVPLLSGTQSLVHLSHSHLPHMPQPDWVVLGRRNEAKLEP
jgi:hypothetical protein